MGSVVSYSPHWIAVELFLEYIVLIGDYNILMLEHLNATAKSPHRVELSELVPRWMEALPKWRAWLCTQTKQTYQQVSQGMPLSDVGGMFVVRRMVSGIFRLYDC